MLPWDTMHLIQRPCYQRGSLCQDSAGNWTTWRSDDRIETQTAVEWTCLPFIRSDQDHMQGTVKGGRRKGRQRKRWKDNIREWAGLEFASPLHSLSNTVNKIWCKIACYWQQCQHLEDFFFLTLWTVQLLHMTQAVTLLNKAHTIWFTSFFICFLLLFFLLFFLLSFLFWLVNRFWMSTVVLFQLTYFPSHQLAYRAATKLLHPCLSLASLWMMIQLSFFVIISIRFHSSSPGCLRSTMLHLSLWGSADCNFGNGVDILAQHVRNPGPLLPDDDGLHILLLAPCSEVTVGDGS